MKMLDLTNDRFGRLQALSISHKGKYGNIYWNTICDCGSKKIVRIDHLRRNMVKSCGCLQKEMISFRMLKHGMAGTKTYQVWKRMRQRCLDINENSYKYYGGRGITICKRWLNSFENFLEDMGIKPKGKSIDRINNEGNYEPNNCRWATNFEQANNKRNNRVLVFNGISLTIPQWARKLKIKDTTIRSRFYRNRNLPTKEILTLV